MNKDRHTQNVFILFERGFAFAIPRKLLSQSVIASWVGVIAFHCSKELALSLDNGY